MINTIEQLSDDSLIIRNRCLLLAKTVITDKLAPNTKFVSEMWQ